jgi:U2-associated protein SR140
LLDALKQETFSHGVRKKTKKEIEKENDERKRIEEEKYVFALLCLFPDSHHALRRAAAIAFAEFEAAFNGDEVDSVPRGRFASGQPPRGPRGMTGGFVRAGGTLRAVGKILYTC